MAEPEVALVEGGGAAAAAAVAPSTSSSPKKMIWIAALAGAAVLGGGVGGFVVAPGFLIHSAPAVAAEGEKSGASHGGEKEGHGEKKKGGHEVPVFELDNLIVNPAGSQGLHFLMASVAFESPDPQTEELLRANEVKLRDVVVATLGDHTIEMLSEPASRDSLKARIRRAVCKEIDAPEGLQVFLPQFVVQ